MYWKESQWLYVCYVTIPMKRPWRKCLHTELRITTTDQNQCKLIKPQFYLRSSELAIKHNNFRLACHLIKPIDLLCRNYHLMNKIIKATMINPMYVNKICLVLTYLLLVLHNSHTSTIVQLVLPLYFMWFNALATWLWQLFRKILWFSPPYFWSAFRIALSYDFRSIPVPSVFNITYLWGLPNAKSSTLT